MIDLYNIGPRVRYGDFLPATLGLVRGIAARLSAVPSVHLSCSSGDTAAIACTRDAFGTVTMVELSMPAMPLDHVVTGDYAKSMLGFLLHELAHMSYTDTLKTAKAKQDTGSTLGAHFINVLEDYFIEYRAADVRDPLTTNAGYLLGRLNDEVQKGAGAQVALAPSKARQGFTYLLCMLNRAGRQGDAMAATIAEARSTVDPRVAAIVDPLMDHMDEVAKRGGGGTATVPGMCVATSVERASAGVRAWRELLALDAAEQAKASEKPEPGEGRPEAGAGKPVDNAGTPEDEDAKPAPVAPASAPASEPGDDLDEARQELLADKAPNVTQQEQRFGYYEVAYMDEPQSVPVPPSDAKPGNWGNVAKHARTVDTGALADAARRLFRSVDTNIKEHGLKVGRLDRRSLVRASMGAVNVFERRSYTPGVRTAVTLMVDMSTSMSNPIPFGVAGNVSKDIAAQAVCVALVPALEAAGTEVSVNFFASHSQMAGTVVPMKAFRKRMPDVTSAARVLGAVRAWGSTPMMQPAMFAERELRSNIWATRRVCVWLCDGEPDEGRATVQAYLTRATCPVEHMAIGIGCYVAIGKRNAAVFDLARLPEVLRQLLTL